MVLLGWMTWIALVRIFDMKIPDKKTPKENRIGLLQRYAVKLNDRISEMSRASSSLQEQNSFNNDRRDQSATGLGPSAG
jgi:hypothetical protein